MMIVDLYCMTIVLVLYQEFRVMQLPVVDRAYWDAALLRDHHFPNPDDASGGLLHRTSTRN